jgi:hypothetical protein
MGMDNLNNNSTNTTNNTDEELSFQEKLEALTKAYEEYEDSLNEIYEEFLLKMTQIRKKDDVRKLENIKLNNNNISNAT